MCGRFAIDASTEELELYFEIERSPLLRPRYNVTPGTQVPAIGVNPRGRRELHLLHWGFFRSGSGPSSSGQLLINARSETVHEKPAFAAAFARQRCLVAGNGFYEWTAREAGKQPYFVRPAEDRLMGMAAIWQRMESPGGEMLACCTILTRAADEPLREIHPRMPVVLPRDCFNAWLDPARGQPELRKLLDESLPAAAFESWPVGRAVGNARAEGPELIEPDPPPGPPRPKGH